MKNLFFVAVAVLYFSGTSISSKAQSGGNSYKSLPVKKTVQFIDDIEIKHDAHLAVEPQLVTEPVVVKPITEGTAGTHKIIPSKNTNFADIEGCSALHFKYAQLMNIEVEAICNVALYGAINNWWATRYSYGGTSKKGVDCSAYTGSIIKEAYGFVIPRMARDQYAASEKISRENLQEGDLVFFNTRGGVSHVGVYLSNGFFTHSSVHSGVTISSLNESYYGKKYIGGGRPIKKDNTGLAKLQ
jgi:NlpC/P60 family